MTRTNFLAGENSPERNSEGCTGEGDLEEHNHGSEIADSAIVVLDQSEDSVPPESAEAADQSYEVEDVLKARKNKEGEMEYLLKWKNFSAKSNTWQNERDLNEVLKDYVKQKNIPLARRGRPRKK